MYDLHTHTYYSDGTDSPRELMKKARDARLRLVAVTDHDTTAGIREAVIYARQFGVRLLCGTEIEAAFSPAKLHILGLGIDVNAECVKKLLSLQAARRAARNGAMLSKLENAGFDVRPYYRTGRGCTTRTHIANALVEAGYAESLSDAFARFIGRGRPFFVDCAHPSMRETVECIMNAGGKAVLAHPHKMKCDHEALVDELASYGLWGVEAYYPGLSDETTEYFKSLAEKHGLFITCGSDYHGANRPDVTPGCAWRRVPELDETYEAIKGLCITGFPTLEEFEDMAGNIAAELPDELFDKLNGGIIVLPDAKLHERSLAERPLYIEGQYVRSSLGRQVILYYGSFARVYRGLSRAEVSSHIRRVLLHELRHHWEGLSGENALELEDEERIENYLRNAKN